MTSSSPRVLLIQTGTPPDDIRHAHGDLPDWFGCAVSLPAEDIEAVRVFEGATLPPPDASRVAIITGSWAMVTDRSPWSEATAAWIRDAVATGMPVFGVCYGHQLMAHALGGRVDYHPDGHEIGTRTVRLSPAAADDPLLTGLPGAFAAHLTHMQSVIESPAGACVLAASDHDPHQMLRYAPNAVSVQFHPEFTPPIMRTVVRAEGEEPPIALDGASNAPEPLRILRRFLATSSGR